MLKLAPAARGIAGAIPADAPCAAGAAVSAWMLLTLFPVPLDNTVSDLKRDGVFHVFFVPDDDGGREHDKFVVLFPYTFVLEDFATVIG